MITEIHMTGTMTNPMKEIFYPDKELIFSSGSYKSFLSDFPLWRGWGLSEEVFVIKILNPHWSLTNYSQIHLFDLRDG